MSYNKVIIIGHLGGDPELRYTPQGKEVCNFSVATSEKWTSGGQQQEKTVWFKITAWGKQAVNASQFLFKGSAVYIEGRLSMEEYTDREGKNRVNPAVNASEIQYLSPRNDSGGGSGGGGRRSPRAEYDQRRAGTDDHDQRQAPSDALPLGNSGDDIPF